MLHWRLEFPYPQVLELQLPPMFSLLSIGSLCTFPLIFCSALLPPKPDAGQAKCSLSPECLNSSSFSGISHDLFNLLEKRFCSTKPPLFCTVPFSSCGMGILLSPVLCVHHVLVSGHVGECPCPGLGFGDGQFPADSLVEELPFHLSSKSTLDMVQVSLNSEAEH